MNSVLTCLLAVSLCAATSSAQGAHDTKASGDAAARADSRERLELTTQVTKQWSCTQGILSLTLKLTFRNTGQRPVILSKRILMGGVGVSLNLDDAAAKKYVTSVRYSDFAGADEPDFGLNPPADLSRFVILRPGETYESEGEDVSIFTRSDELPSTRRRVGVDLNDGTHFLRIAVGTWPYVTDPEPIQQEWKHKGFLWSEGLLSEPMPFRVNKDQPIIKCP